MDKLLYGVSFVAAVASGVAMAMMQVVFGDFVGLINDFYSGIKTPAEFRDGVGTYASVMTTILPALSPNSSAAYISFTSSSRVSSALIYTS